jgi:hypothetical protein
MDYTQLRQSFQNIGIKVFKRALQSYNFVSGVIGWKISADGVIEAVNLILSGIVSATGFFFGVTTTPSATDGMMWCALNGSYKVLWGYWGGIGSKQQISMSKMFAQGDWDNDNTAGGSDLTKDLEIPTWFQPRSVDAKAFMINSAQTELGISTGFAQNGSQGVNTGMKFKVKTVSNVVSGLSVNYINNLFSGSNLAINPNPQIPVTIDGGGHVTSKYDDTGKDLLVGNSFSYASAVNSLSWTNNSLMVFDTALVWQNNTLLSDKDAASFATLNAYAYVLSWTDTKVTIRIVCKPGFRLFCHFNVIG